MVSVERIKQYDKLEMEAAEHTDYPLPTNWPCNKGGIEFRHVTLQYEEGHRPALDDISFTVGNHEKVSDKVIIAI